MAHAAATAADMFEGRFYFGLGTGEALNELVTGERWPSARERLARLREAIEIMHELFTGERVDYDGEYYTVNDARLFTRPQEPPHILIASAAPASARLAAENDGLIATTPEKDLVKEFESAGGKDKPRVGQITLCWDESEAEARRIARKYWATTVLSWETRSWVTTPEMFEDITKNVTEEEVAKNIPCGPDLGPALKQLRAFQDAGFDHVYVHQIGPKQEEFLAVMRDQFLPQVRKQTRRAA
jgi:G6PDH family F420-dependent oxidoreductase